MQNATRIDGRGATGNGAVPGAVRPRRLLAAPALWAELAVVAILNATVRELLVAPPWATTGAT